MRKMLDTKCECGDVKLDRLLDPEKVPACEQCGKTPRVVPWTQAAHEGVRVQAAKVIGDDIPGGLLIEHGICADDGTPIRYYSKTDIRRAAKSKGLIWGGDEARHITAPKMGTDKNPNTVRHVSIPLMGKDEEDRKRAWHEHENQLQAELQQKEGV